VVLTVAWQPDALAAPPESQQHTVLTIHWGTEDFPAAPIVDAAIRQTLAADPDAPIDYFAEYLESDHFPAEEASEALAEYIRRKYRHKRIDVVIANADPSLQFVLHYRTALFPDTPVVYSGVSLPESLSVDADGGLTAVMRGAAYVETLEIALKLHPLTKQVFVIANGQDPRNARAIRARLRPFQERVNLTYLDQETVRDLLAALKTIGPGSLVLFIWHSQIDPPPSLYADQIARLVAEVSPVPVYGTNERYVGSGIVGGVVRKTRDTGVRMGEMARQIIHGTRPMHIPIEDAEVVAIFDWRQLRRWGVHSSVLPPESEIRFRDATIWGLYRGYVVGTMVVVAAQLVLIVALVTQRTKRRRAEEALRMQEATLRTSYERTRQLAGRLMSVQEATYAKIARNLHDDVCQDLVALSLDICSLKRAAGTIEHVPVQMLSKLEQWALALANTVRRLSHDLHPATLGLLGLASAIKTHCLELEKRHGVEVLLTAEGDLRRIRREVSVSLFRMTQEALRNGVVHGRARHLNVFVWRLRHHIELSVTDDGTGFDLETARCHGKGLGIVSMEERAHALGGSLHITTGPGRGTNVYVRVPADSADGADTAPSMEGV
jgi:signal transduction histidine kinase/ABC-type uncharacterized transport system substrate-binding protein